MRKFTGLAVSLMALSLLATACNSGGGTSAGPGSDADASAVVAEAKAVVEEAKKRPTVPELEPIKVVPGKTIGYVVCGEVAPSCHLMGQVAKEAIEAAGYEAVLLDGKVSVQGWADADRQLINRKVDAIINNVAGDALVESAVREAREAGIPVFCQMCYNIQQPVDDPEKYGSVANADADFVQEGRTMASYMIAEKEGKPQAGLLADQLALTVVGRMNGIKETFAKCESLGCQYHEQELGQSGDLNAQARKLTDSFLQRYPKGQLDYLAPPSDSQSLGIQQALATSRRDDTTIAGWDCLEPNVGFMKDGGKYQKVDVATPIVWSSWAIVDQAVRVLAGEEGQDIVLPSQLVTTENLPEGTTCEKSSDYADLYKKAWITEGE